MENKEPQQNDSKEKGEPDGALLSEPAEPESKTEKSETIIDKSKKIKKQEEESEKSVSETESDLKRTVENPPADSERKRWRLSMGDKKGWQEISQDKKEEAKEPSVKEEVKKPAETKPKTKKQAVKIIEEKIPEENIDSDAEFLSRPDFEKDAKRTVEAFRNITTNEKGEHRHLAKERNEMAALNIEARGGRIVRGKEAIEKARQEIAEKEAIKIRNEFHEEAMETLIARLPEKYKNNEEALTAYIETIKDKLEIVGPDRDVAFDKLVNDGYLVENAKKRWFSYEFKIPKSGEKKPAMYNPALHFETLIKNANLSIASTAQERADLKIEQGRKKMKQERQRCMKEIVISALSDYKIKQQEKPKKTNQRKQTIASAKDASERYREERLREIQEKQAKGEKLTGADKVVLGKLGIKIEPDISMANDIIKFLQENITRKTKIDSEDNRGKPKNNSGKKFNPSENGGRTFKKRYSKGMEHNPVISKRNYSKSKKS
jgi:hypothetical protein